MGYLERMRRYTAIPAAIASATICSLAGDLPDEAKARTRYDVSTASIGSPPASAVRGGSFSVKWRTARSGRSAALKKARLVFRLSTDRKRSRGDVKLGRGASLSKLAKKTALSGRTRLTMPATTKAGSYYLVACVEGKGLRDRRRANDCRASARKVTVASASGGGLPPGGGGPPSGGTPGGGGPGALNATPTFDTADRQSKWITTAGGSISAEDSDTGTVYTLTLPEDALVSDAQITITPVSSLAGVPGGLVGAVKLEPEGLVLNKPATLEIAPEDPSTAPPADRQVAFTSEGDGKDFHLLPDPDGGLAVEILHFSIPGVGDMTSSDAASVASRPPARSQAQYESEMRDAVSKEDIPREVAISRDYYRDVVKPKLQAALSSDDAMDAAFASELSWQRLASVLGIDDELAPEIGEALGLLRDILRNAADRAYNRCVQNHDLAAVRRMLQVERTAQLMGFSDEAQYADVMTKVGNCLRFELDFESELQATLEDGGWTYHLRALGVPFGPATAGEGPLNWLEWDGRQQSSGQCNPGPPPRFQTSTITPEGTDDGVIRPGLTMDVAPRLPGAPVADPLAHAGIAVITEGAIEHNRVTITGECGDNTGIVNTRNWEAFFGMADLDVTKSANAGATPSTVTIYVAPERGADALLLTETSTTDVDGLTETTTLKVWHRPLP